MSAKSQGGEPGAWWGWGRGEHVKPLSKGMEELLAERFGSNLSAPPAAVKAADIVLPDPRPAAGKLESNFRGSLETAQPERLSHSVGMSYPDLIRLRSGEVTSAPDAVAYPRSAAEIRALLEQASHRNIAIVPFGGGTSVVGGVTATRADHDALVSLDLSGIDRVEVDLESGTARFGPGVKGPEAERLLNDRGFTLGHFPQSFERASIGGFAATRSAGQASSGYGRFDDLLTGIEMVTPVGTLRSIETPHTAAGPDLRELVVGSEGALGVITEVSCRVSPAAEVSDYRGWMCEGFEAGFEVIRDLAQQRALPDVVRLSDESETSIGLATTSAPEPAKRALEAWLTMRNRRAGALLICGWDGTRERVRTRRKLSGGVIRRGGGVPLGSAPGNAWQRTRFEGPYLRDHLIDLGVLVETLETAHSWSSLGDLYRATRDSIQANLGSGGLVMCHLSHAYPDGASLYFTFVAPVRPGDEIATWRRIKEAACDAIVGQGGTITHHHAVGRDHTRWMEREVGIAGLDVLRSVKEELDPRGIMNPGVLLPG